ncbi:CinA family protein [Amaricoccus tamworthensis]|uniref:CinA family protein n=1 Tax=Amaricoccus tamworthensis TaxID=57002 RepID=UPI003C7B810E
MEEIATRLLDVCRSRGIMTVTAESCTGGMVSAALTAIPGSSDVVDRGFVTYSYAAKTAHLNVSTGTLAEHGAVSEPVARQMAVGAIKNSDAQLSIAITGVAGPGASEAKPEGLVWFGLSFEGRTLTEKREFGAIGRENVRMRSVETALALALQLVDAP